MAVNWVDIAIVAILLISIVISLIRGFTKEALSLVAWILAGWVAITFSDELDLILSHYLDLESIRMLLAFTILFVMTLFLGAFVNMLIAHLIQKSGLSGTDRAIGVFFGALRGVVIVALLVLIGTVSGLAEQSWWQDSLLLPWAEEFVSWVEQFLPKDFSNQFRYS